MLRRYENNSHMKKKIGIKDRPNKVKKWREFLKESIFVSKDDVDQLLDKISTSGINSLSDVERNRLTLFSDKYVLKLVKKKGQSLKIAPFKLI